MKIYSMITILDGAECFNFNNATIEYNGAEACRITIEQSPENFSELLKLGVSFSTNDTKFVFILDNWKDIAGVR